MQHAICSASSAPIWGNGCTAYPGLAAMFPDNESEDTILGNGAHEVVEPWIRTGIPPSLGTVTQNGTVVTQEMINYLQVYIDVINNLRRRYPEGEVFIEHTVGTPIHEHCWGTLDFGFYVRSLRHAFVYDLKYGFLKREVDDQLFVYGNGFVDELVTQRHRPVETVTLGVVQPRAYHFLGPVREETMHVSGLAESFRRLSQRASEVFSNPQTKVGKHCRYCPVMQHCEANQEAVDYILDFAGSAQLNQLSNKNLGIYLSLMKRAQSLLNDRLEVLEEEAVHRLESGQPVPGFRKGFGRSSRDWKIPINELKTVGEMIGEKLTKEVALTPKQVEDLGVDKKLVASYVTKTPGKSALRVGDPSEIAQKVFKI